MKSLISTQLDLMMPDDLWKLVLTELVFMQPIKPGIRNLLSVVSFLLCFFLVLFFYRQFRAVGTVLQEPRICVYEQGNHPFLSSEVPEQKSLLLFMCPFYSIFFSVSSPFCFFPFFLLFFFFQSLCELTFL